MNYYFFSLSLFPERAFYLIIDFDTRRGLSSASQRAHRRDARRMRGNSIFFAFFYAIRRWGRASLIVGKWDDGCRLRWWGHISIYFNISDEIWLKRIRKNFLHAAEIINIEITFSDYSFFPAKLLLVLIRNAKMSDNGFMSSLREQKFFRLPKKNSAIFFITNFYSIRIGGRILEGRPQ